jgi:hypothetical protein
MTDLRNRIAEAIAELELELAEDSRRPAAGGDMAARVVDELRAGERTRPTGVGAGLFNWAAGLRRPTPGPAIAVAVCLAAGLLVAIEPARTAMADFLGFGATRIEHREQPELGPTDSRLEKPSTSETPEIGDQQDRGSSDVPSGTVAAPNPIPSLGLPRIEDGSTGMRRRFIWQADDDLPALGDGGPGLVLEVRLLAGPPDLKTLAAVPATEFLTIDVESGPAPALWIPTFHRRQLDEMESATSAGPTLLWTVGDLQFRLEADIDRDRATALAAQVTGGTELLAAG